MSEIKIESRKIINLLLIIIGLELIMNIIWFVVNLILRNTSDLIPATFIDIFYKSMSIIEFVVPLVFAIMIKDKKVKTFLIVYAMIKMFLMLFNTMDLS